MFPLVLGLVAWFASAFLMAGAACLGQSRTQRSKPS
jgi:hypothetical protein